MMRVRNDTDDHRSMIYGSGIYPNTHTHTHMDSNQKKKKKCLDWMTKIRIHTKQ